MQLLVDGKTGARLGPQGLHMASRNVFNNDCQSCGQRLSEKCTLYVQDFVEWIAVSLHHPECKEPYWNDSSGFIMSSQPNSTFGYFWLIGPRHHLLQPPGESQAVMVLNPSIETVHLKKDGKGNWHVDYRYWDEIGFTLLSEDFDLALPIPKSSVVTNESSATVTIKNKVMLGLEAYAGPWHCGEDLPEYTNTVKSNGGLLLVVTHMINAFRDPSPEEFFTLIQLSEGRMGWIPLALGKRES